MISYLISWTTSSLIYECVILYMDVGLSFLAGVSIVKTQNMADCQTHPLVGVYDTQ